MRWRALGVVFPLMLVSCGSLPTALRDEISAEHDRLLQADRQLKRAGEAVQKDGAPDASARLQAAQAKLDRAKADGVELDKAAKGPGNNEARRKTEQLLAEERDLRLAALRDSDGVEAEAAKWIDYKANTPKYVAKVKSEYDAIRATDLSKVSAAVAKAEKDWPAKKVDLDARLASLKKVADSAGADYAKNDGSVATLIAADDALARDATQLTSGADQLTAMTGQLYYSWDKILEDLDRDGGYREKVKIVKSHFEDAASKKADVSSDVEWTSVSANAYRAVENDLGMAIAHKDAGLYDSEASTLAQPPGFAYIATPEQGRNQYGYWDHAGGGSVWTWLPEYLIMRELFWGPRYTPIYVNEYNGYYTARNLGHSYYGNATPAAPPRYGTHGTFTEQRYAGSRYVQSGGFKGSAYSSGGSSATSSTRPSFGEREGSGSSVGKRFGGRPSGEGGASPMPSGKRFWRWCTAIGSA